MRQGCPFTLPFFPCPAPSASPAPPPLPAHLPFSFFRSLTRKFKVLVKVRLIMKCSRSHLCLLSVSELSIHQLKDEALSLTQKQLWFPCPHISNAK